MGPEESRLPTSQNEEPKREIVPAAKTDSEFEAAKAPSTYTLIIDPELKREIVYAFTVPFKKVDGTRIDLNYLSVGDFQAKLYREEGKESIEKATGGVDAVKRAAKTAAKKSDSFTKIWDNEKEIILSNKEEIRLSVNVTPDQTHPERKTQIVKVRTENFTITFEQESGNTKVAKNPSAKMTLEKNGESTKVSINEQLGAEVFSPLLKALDDYRHRENTQIAQSLNQDLWTALKTSSKTDWQATTHQYEGKKGEKGEKGEKIDLFHARLSVDGKQLEITVEKSRANFRDDYYTLVVKDPKKEDPNIGYTGTVTYEGNDFKRRHNQTPANPFYDGTAWGPDLLAKTVFDQVHDKFRKWYDPRTW